MSKPSILCSEGEPLKSTDDARMVLNNGKHVVQALKVVLEASGLDAIEAEEWCVGDLGCTFREGLYVDFVEYPEDDRDAQVAMQVFAHEQEQNKYRPSSIADKVSITLRLHMKSKGGEWTLTQKTLLGILGPSKTSTCYRWVCLARDLEPVVLAHIKQKRQHLPVTYVTDNKFLLGRGESARYKLSSRYANAALDRLFDALEGGKAVTSKDFMNDYCMAFKQLEAWEKQQIAKFGKVAKDFAAFHRVVRCLQTEQGRQKLVLCLAQRLPISGSESSTHYGVEEAKAVVMEMQKMKAGADPTKHGEQATGGVSPDSGGVSPGEAASSAQGKSASGEAAGGDGMEVDDGDLLIEEGEIPKDPVMQKAEALMEAEACHINIHTTREDFKEDVQSRVLKSHKSIIVIEAPSSKPKVFTDLFKFAETLGKQSSSYLIPVGNRTDLLSQVVATVTRQHPKRPIFVLQIGNETQTQHTRSSFAVHMPAVGSSSAVPCFVSVAGCRAKASEGLRLRCVDPRCSMRTDDADSSAGLDPEAADADLHEDDQEFGEFDPRDSVEEDDAEEGDLAMASGMFEERKETGKFKRNLFPFASPVAFHSQILHRVLNASRFSHMLILTRSAHPGLYVAARDCKLECLVFVEGAKEHCLAHGKDLLCKMLVAKNYKSAKEQVGIATTAVKRVRASSLPFIVVKGPPVDEQAIHIREVEPESSSTWRAGFNNRPRSLEEKMVNLLQKELCDHALLLDKGPGGVMSLFTLTARREDEVLCPLRGLLFDTLPALEGFLSEGGNKILSDRIVRVDGVVVEHTGGVSPVYVAFTGVGRYLRHFAGLRKGGPNTQIVVHCEKGAGDGFLSLVVATRNAAGIAARSQVVLNFGNEFDLTYKPDMEESGVKRFCGTLEKYFEKAGEGSSSGVSLTEQGENREAGKEEEDKKAESKKEEEEEEKRKKAESKKAESKKVEDEAKNAEEEAKKKKKAEEEEAKKKKKAEEEEAKKKKAEEEEAKGDARASGTELGTRKQPFPFKVMFQEAEAGAAAAQLRIVSAADANKKLAPKTLLWTLKKASGAISQTEERQGLTWSFTSTKTWLGTAWVCIIGSRVLIVVINMGCPRIRILIYFDAEIP